jgi:glycine cleavage system aminomethyltransferase T
VHFRGHVNRHLRGVRAGGVEPVPRGATLHDPAGAQVGEVRSAVRSPMLGGIGLAMVRREVPAGTQLVARWPEEGTDGPAERRVDVATLPFVAN